MARELVYLVCQECKRKNYVTDKNRRLHPNRVEFKKYCKFDRKHTIHKEGR